jgi:hypothetical protein
MQTHAGDNDLRVRPFADRVGRAPCGGGFRMDGYWVWGASVATGEDGLYHMFASRWPKTYPFFQGYTAASEIAHAVADSPVGPFEFREVVLGPRDPEYWDGRIAHNPSLLRTKDGWWLFYCGATYAPDVTPEEMWELNRHTENSKNGLMPPWFHDMRTGVAFARDLNGPWQRPDQPLNLWGLSKNGGKRTVNATAVETFDGKCRIYYRHSGVGLVTALAESPAGPYPVDSMLIISDYSQEAYTEDPYVFRIDDHYEGLTKDSTGQFTGEEFALRHIVSADGVSWRSASEPKGCSRTVAWDDGQTREQGNLERPFVLIEDGRPTHLYAATSDGVHSKSQAAHYNAKNTWNMVLPLA